MAVVIYTEKDFEGMRKAGGLAAEVLDYITDFVKPGVSTKYLNDLCAKKITEAGAISAPYHYTQTGINPYPAETCISVNHVVCHGIPSDDKILQEGDILNIDITPILNGYYGDTSRMYYAGNPTVKGKLLTECTYNCLMNAISQVKPGNTLGDIGYAIQSLAEKKGFSVVYDFVGHGVGKEFHGDPQIRHYGKKGEGMTLKEGMIFTIEPMINAGKPDTITSSLNGWTATTRDKSLSAQFEHSMGVTKNGVEIFTLSKKGYTMPPYQN
ncbi:MAG: type I methionyl aminopeptidase [Rickettsiales bacterium]|nr:MAG: type I methionyl aminopeptidase [Rickettsiales bacterium]